MPTRGQKIAPPRPPRRSQSAENGAFWWWRAPNDALRTGQKADLDAVLPLLSKNCLVWRAGWAKWHYAAEIAELRSGIPAARQMPLVTPEKIDGQTEPPPLPAVCDLLCSTKSETITQRRVTDRLAVAARSVSVWLAASATRVRRRIATFRRSRPRVTQGAVIAALVVVLVSSVAVIAISLTRTSAPSKALVFVTVAGPGDTWVAEPSIYLDGELRCNSSPCRIDTPPGLHFMAASAPGFARSADRAIQAKGEQIIHFELVPGATADANTSFRGALARR